MRFYLPLLIASLTFTGACTEEEPAAEEAATEEGGAEAGEEAAEGEEAAAAEEAAAEEAARYFPLPPIVYIGVSCDFADLGLLSSELCSKQVGRFEVMSEDVSHDLEEGCKLRLLRVCSRGV